MMNLSLHGADLATVPVAHEAEIAVRALIDPLGKSGEVQPVDDSNARVKEITAVFRAGLEEKYGAHLSSDTQEIIWEAARAFAPNRTWAETEVAYRKMAEQLQG